jgi:hypothetical protein
MSTTGWVWWYICHPSYQRSINRRIAVQGDPGIKQDPISKITNTKMTGGMVGLQVVGSLPSKCKALNSIP